MSGEVVAVSLHDRLYAARAAREVREQQQWAEGLRDLLEDPPLATVTPMIPAPRSPSEESTPSPTA